MSSSKGQPILLDRWYDKGNGYEEVVRAITLRRKAMCSSSSANMVFNKRQTIAYGLFVVLATPVRKDNSALTQI